MTELSRGGLRDSAPCCPLHSTSTSRHHTVHQHTLLLHHTPCLHLVTTLLTGTPYCTPCCSPHRDVSPHRSPAHPAVHHTMRCISWTLPSCSAFMVDDSKVVVITSTELRCHSIEMEVLEAEGPAIRRSTRTAARSATSRAHHTRKHRLPIDAGGAILKACF